MIQVIIIFWLIGSIIALALAISLAGKEIIAEGSFGYKILILIAIFSWITVALVLEKAVYLLYLKIKRKCIRQDNF